MLDEWVLIATDTFSYILNDNIPSSLLSLNQIFFLLNRVDSDLILLRYSVALRLSGVFFNSEECEHQIYRILQYLEKENSIRYRSE